MSTFDTIVLGAGPAGATAAVEAGGLGLRTLLVDEALHAGGQVYRAPGPAIRKAPPSADGDAGRELRNQIRDAVRDGDITTAFGRRVWFAGPGFDVAAVGPEGPESFDAKTLIVATGAQERVVPVPGWTLPGVYGLAAATLMLKAEKVLPGNRVLVAGSGPLLLLVAAGIIGAGGRVVAVADLASTTDWLRCAPDLVRRPDLVARGLRWRARLASALVPIFSRHAVARIEGGETVERAVVRPLGGGRERPLEVDAVCLGHGLMPSTEITRLLGARHDFDPGQGGWRPRTDGDGMTSVDGLFTCGDGAGVLGAAAAPLTGRLAALGVARRLGVLDSHAHAVRAAPIRAELARAGRFGGAMTRIAMPPPALADLITPETLVCRCEALPRSALDRAIDAGAVTVDGLKAATRCGMGPCGGRFCSETAALLIQNRTGRSRVQIGPGTSRPPLRPVPLDVLTGAVDYDDLPIPEPAPL